MSHFATLVILPKGTPTDRDHVERAVTLLLEPFDENAGGDKWDWWTLGGRWTGALDGYNPRLDPANYDPCIYCGATGTRVGTPYKRHHTPDPKDCCPYPVIGEGCNACHGTGHHLRYRVNDHDGDIRPVSEIHEGVSAFALVTPDGEWRERGRMGWFGMAFDEKDEHAWRREWSEVAARYGDHVVAIVDCHV